MNAWQLQGLPAGRFEALFALGDEELRRLGAIRRRADESPGYPCRVSLEDADIGEELILLSFEHHAVDSPYRAAGPIFVRRGARARVLEPGEVPPYVTRRLMSLRAYDAASGMVAGLVCEGADVASQLDTLFADPEVRYVQLHNARRGCYACEARRVTP